MIRFRKKLGSYLIQSQFQCAGNAAQNLLCLKLAEELGLVIASPWVTWFKAASLHQRLEAMGPVTTNEWFMIRTVLLAVSLWVLGYVIFDKLLAYVLANLTSSFCGS